MILIVGGFANSNRYEEEEVALVIICFGNREILRFAFLRMVRG